MALQLLSKDTLQNLLDELGRLIGQRIKSNLKKSPANQAEDLDARFIQGHKIFRYFPEIRDNKERLIVLIALVPHLQPNFFESIILEHMPTGGDFPEFGGVKGTSHRGMLPTGETVQFILAGGDLTERLSIHKYFAEDHFFCRRNILWLEPVREGEPVMSGRIILTQEWIDRLILDKETAPRFGLDFPAKRINTAMVWEDAVLHPQTLRQVNDLAAWLEHHHLLDEDENLRRKVKPGYRVLFHGPSGTGKTLTA